MKTYNEFRKDFVKSMNGKKYTQEQLSKAWKDYKTEGLKTPAKTKTTLPPEVKAINKKLTAKLNDLFALRKEKKDGKDVAVKIKNALKFLTEKRIEKKALMNKLGL